MWCMSKYIAAYTKSQQATEQSSFKAEEDYSPEAVFSVQRSGSTSIATVCLAFSIVNLVGTNIQPSWRCWGVGHLFIFIQQTLFQFVLSMECFLFFLQMCFSIVRQNKNLTRRLSLYVAMLVFLGNVQIINAPANIIDYLIHLQLFVCVCFAVLSSEL